MLLSKSPVRSISEKLKSPQASIKDMKIERKKDFRSFLKYIERESKELEKIKLPSRNEVTKKSGSGGIGALLGFGALGLLGLLGGMGDKGNMYKYGDKNLGGNIFRGPYAVGRKGGDDDQKIDDPDLTRSGFPNIRDFTSTSAALKNAFEFGSVKAAKIKETTIEDVTQTESFQRKAKKITKQQQKTLEYSATTQGGERVPTIEDLRQEQTGGGGGGSKKKFTTNPLKGPDDFAKRTGQVYVPFDSKNPDATIKIPDTPIKGKVKFKGNDVFFEIPKLGDRKLDVIDLSGREYYFFDAKDSSTIQGKILNKKLTRQSKAIDEVLFSDKFKVDATSGDIVKKGFFQSIKRDFKKPTLGINTMEDMFSKLRLGKKTDLFKANPKGMNLFKLGTFSKGKTGFMIADFGLAAYDLYSSLRKVTPRSNIGASLLDLIGINLNNFVADMLNNPSMLREYVSVTNDPNAINVNRNREIINENIRKIKEQNKKDFTGEDITKGSITGKQMMENMKKYFTNPQTYNPFSTYQVKPNPDLFTKPSGDPNDDVLGMFQSATLEAN